MKAGTFWIGFLILVFLGASVWGGLELIHLARFNRIDRDIDDAVHQFVAAPGYRRDAGGPLRPVREDEAAMVQYGLLAGGYRSSTVRTWNIAEVSMWSTSSSIYEVRLIMSRKRGLPRIRVVVDWASDPDNAAARAHLIRLFQERDIPAVFDP